MEFLKQAVAVLAIAIAFTGCQRVAEQRINWDITTWKQECFGDRTVSCVNRKVKINLRIIDYTIDQIREHNEIEKRASRPSFDDAQLSAGIAAIEDNVIEAAKKQRPGLFARWFLGGSQYWDVPRFFTTEFITQDMIMEVFEAGVRDYNQRHDIQNRTGIPGGITPAEVAQEDAAPSNTGNPGSAEPANDAPAASPQTQAEALYTLHPDFHSNPAAARDLLSPRLLALLEREQRCVEEHGVCAIGADPWMAAQDGERTGPVSYRVHEQGNAPHHATVEVCFGFVFGTHPAEQRCAMLAMERQANALWQVDDLISPDGQSLQQVLGQP